MVCCILNPKPSRMEVWKPVVGAERYYEVSDMGNVRSLDRIVRHNYGGTAIRRGRLLKQFVTDLGYHMVAIQVNGSAKSTGVHRLVCAAFNGTSDKPTVNHKDGNKSNNVPANLEWATYLENQRHADETGLRQIRGERNGRAKLSLEDVRSIRERVKSIKYGDQSRIAREYGVTPQMVRHILLGNSWKQC